MKLIVHIFLVGPKLKVYQRMISLVKDQICFTHKTDPMGHSTPIHTPIQSQIVIILSKDGACSITSEESSLIDVGVDNPGENIDVNDIPMEVVSDPIASDNEVIISTDK